MKLFLKIAIKNIIDHSKQSKAALLSIAVAFISLVLFQGYIKDVFIIMESQYTKRSMLGDFMIENKLAFTPEATKEPWKFYITETEQNEIRKIIEENLGKNTTLCSVLRLSGMIQKKNQQFLFIGSGYDKKNCVKIREPEWVIDAMFGKSLHQVERDDVILLGQTLAKNFDCERKNKKEKSGYNKRGFSMSIGEIECQNGSTFNLSTLTVNGQINSNEFELVGMFDGGFVDLDARVMHMNLDQAQALYDTKGLSFISFRSEELKENQVKFKKIKTLLPQNIQITTWKEHPMFGDFYRRTIGLMDLLKNFVAIIIFIVVSLSVTNSLLKNIKERSKEIGTFRSLGFNKSQIKNIFNLEVVFLSIAGCFIGACVSIILTLIMNAMDISYKAGQFVEATPMRIAFDFKNYIFVSFGITLLAVIGSQIVVTNTLKKSAAENLNHA